MSATLLEKMSGFSTTPDPQGNLEQAFPNRVDPDTLSLPLPGQPVLPGLTLEELWRGRHEDWVTTDPTETWSKDDNGVHVRGTNRYYSAARVQEIVDQLTEQKYEFLDEEDAVLFYEQLRHAREVQSTIDNERETRQNARRIRWADRFDRLDRWSVEFVKDWRERREQAAKKDFAKRWLGPLATDRARQDQAAAIHGLHTRTQF